MPMLIIYYFEIVQIDIGQGESVFAAAGTAALTLRDFQEGPSIGQSGQSVDPRRLLVHLVLFA